LPWAGGRVSHVERLAQEFGCALPGELSEYVGDFVPIRHFELRQLGNPIVVYGLEGDQRLGFEQPGYNKHGLTGESLEGWERAWFLLADQAAIRSSSICRGATRKLDRRCMEPGRGISSRLPTPSANS
jgi:hypothetical protein